MLTDKYEARMSVQKFVTLVERQFNTAVKHIRSDNGPEFLMSDFYASKGIIHERSCVETLQQNGKVERKHQHMLNVAHALYCDDPP